jgi:putative transferase (TIGR04331 family)
MKKNLVTACIEETYSKNEINVISGLWCYPNISKALENSKNKLNQFHWDDNKKLNKDHAYLEGLYIKTLNSITPFLNNYHKITRNEKYWNIIIWNFLFNFIQILWDRWENVENILKNNNIEETKVIDLNYRDFIFSDAEEFIKNIDNDYWNHYLYSRIIDFKDIKNLNISKIINKNKNLIKKNRYKKHSNDKKLYDNIIRFFSLKDNIILYKTNFEKKNFIKLCLKLKKIPRYYTELESKIYTKNLPDREKINLNINPENNFEKLFQDLVIKSLPASYLENFNNILHEVKKIKLNPKVIFTSTAHSYEDFFKIWSAEKNIKGAKLIISDHGGYIEEKKNLNSHLNFADQFLAWNYDDNKKTKHMPPSIFFKNYDKSKNTKYNKILLVSTTTPRYPFRIQSSPISGQILKTVKLWEDFYANLDANKKKIFKLRPHPQDTWRIKDYFQNTYGEEIISNEKSFYNDLTTSTICVNSSFATTFYESMYSGKPTILLFNEEVFSIQKDINNLLNELADKKILFKDAEKAYIHLNNIWNDPLKWWNSNTVTDLRKRFENLCFLKKDNDLKFWTNFFKSF